jgi:hypothetical protein
MDVNEGMSPLSNDSSIQRAIRKHMTPRARRHMRGDDLYRIPDPEKKIRARLKRKSRHQPKPETDKVSDFLISKNGKNITESDFENIDKKLLHDVVGLLIAMSSKGWSSNNNTVTNGNYFLEDVESVSINDGELRFNGKQLSLDWDWLHNLRTML